MSPQTKAAKETVTLVEFRYGDVSLNVIRFTDDSVNQSAPIGITPAGLFYSQPTMEVILAPRTGVLEEEPTKLRFIKPVSGFLDKITNGEPFAPVLVTIWEFTKDADLNTDLTIMFKGRLGKATRNKDGVDGQVEIEVKSSKEGWENFPLGIEATHQCAWRFGGPGCGAVVGFDDYTVTLIAGTQVTINSVPIRRDRYYNKGFFQRDGLRIKIRDWRNGATFEMVRQPPADWLNKPVRVFQGCDQLIETCKLIGNEQKFAGFGYAMLSYNPLFETDAEFEVDLSGNEFFQSLND